LNDNKFDKFFQEHLNKQKYSQIYLSMQTSDRLVTKNSFIQKESILIFYETSEYSF